MTADPSCLHSSKCREVNRRLFCTVSKPKVDHNIPLAPELFLFEGNHSCKVSLKMPDIRTFFFSVVRLIRVIARQFGYNVRKLGKETMS